MSDHSHPSRPTGVQDEVVSQSQRSSRDASAIPRLETPEEDDTDLAYFYAGDGEADHRWEDNARRSFEEGSLKPGQPLMRHQNRSTPTIASPSESSYGDRANYDPTAALNFSKMSINGHYGPPRNPSQHYPPPNARPTQGGPPPRHGSPMPSHWGARSGSIHSISSSVRSGYDNDARGYVSPNPEYEQDAPNGPYSPEGRRPPGPAPYTQQRGPPPPGYAGAPPGQYPPPQGYAATTPGWYPPPPQQQYPLEHNPLYAAASDVLGLGPPPGQEQYPGPSQAPLPHTVSAPYVQQHGPPYPRGPPPHPSGGFAPYPSGPGVALRAPSGSSLGHPDGRPSLQRAGTTISNLSSLNTRKSKAIDVKNPPYTKEYVDDYRMRVKADPDPEAHFLYAKYLIDAAKKIGHDNADQKAVRKYRDSLIVESLKVIRRLATQGETYPEAQFFLANCHGTGMLGLTVDHERAYHLYIQGAKQNHPAACYRVAVCNDIGAGTKKDPGRAFTFYRKAASLGDTAAMYKLGTILLRGGLGQAPNAREGVAWLKRAAEQADEENPHALHTLASLHEKEDNEGHVSFDLGLTIELYTRAAQLGHVPSQLKLGSAYETGALGCPVDPRRSIAWYTKAAEKGDPEAELCVSGWYLTGAEGILKQSDSEAYLWARKSANKGWPRAEYAVGYYAEVGIGVQQDMELAKKWYMRAAAQGNKRAMARLTELKRLGNKRSNAARPTRQQANDEGCIIM